MVPDRRSDRGRAAEPDGIAARLQHAPSAARGQPLRARRQRRRLMKNIARHGVSLMLKRATAPHRRPIRVRPRPTRRSTADLWQKGRRTGPSENRENANKLANALMQSQETLPPDHAPVAGPATGCAGCFFSICSTGRGRSPGGLPGTRASAVDSAGTAGETGSAGLGSGQDPIFFSICVSPSKTVCLTRSTKFVPWRVRRRHGRRGPQAWRARSRRGFENRLLRAIIRGQGWSATDW